MAARTLVRPLKAAPTPANTLAQVPNEPRASPTTGAKEGIAARSEVPAATDEPATAVTAVPPTTTNQAAVKAPVKKNATKKPNVTWRYALRDEPVELVPGQYHTSLEEAGTSTSVKQADTIVTENAGAASSTSRARRIRDSDASYKAKQPWEWAKGSPAIKDVKAILRD